MVSPSGEKHSPLATATPGRIDRRTALGVPVVERSERLAGVVLFVHGAEHEPPVTIGAPVVAPGRGETRLDRMQVAHGAGVAVEASDALRERRDQVASVTDGEAAQPVVERQVDRPRRRTSVGADDDRGCRSTATPTAPASQTGHSPSSSPHSTTTAAVIRRTPINAPLLNARGSTPLSPSRCRT